MPTNFFSCFLNFFTFFSSSTHCFAESSLFRRELIVPPSTHCFAERSLFRRALSLYTKPTPPSFYCFTRTPRRRAFTVPYMPHVAEPYLFTQSPRRRAFTVSHAPHVAEPSITTAPTITQGTLLNLTAVTTTSTS